MLYAQTWTAALQCWGLGLWGRCRQDNVPCLIHHTLIMFPIRAREQNWISCSSGLGSGERTVDRERVHGPGLTTDSQQGSEWYPVRSGRTYSLSEQPRPCFDRHRSSLSSGSVRASVTPRAGGCEAQHRILQSLPPNRSIVPRRIVWRGGPQRFASCRSAASV